MLSRRLFRCASTLGLLITVSCTYVSVSDGQVLRFTHRFQSGQCTLGATGPDSLVARDVAEALRRHAPRINAALRQVYHAPVVVALFPDQESLDKHGMNPGMKGHYAYSGHGRIEMVSPRIPTATARVGYHARVLIAVHEYALSRSYTPSSCVRQLNADAEALTLSRRAPYF